MRFNLAFVLTVTFSLVLSREINYNDDWNFPKNLLIGVASSAYQVEGGWNESDKGENIWDYRTHNTPWMISDGSNGDVAADSFHKYKEDVAIIKDIGFDFYRFSISWSRILPNGFTTKVSKDGIQYYNNLIDEVKERGLEPFVTIFHIDTPAIFGEFGLWTNEIIVDQFVEYSRIIFREFGSKVKFFTTINAANVFCEKEAGTSNAMYICLHNFLKAHAKVYHMYNEEFRRTQNGKIGIVLQCKHYFGETPNDTLTPDIAFQYDCGWAAHPIFSKDGDYPKVMRDRIAENSKFQGWPQSKLPKFSREEIEYIRGTADYFGLNHYAAKIAIPVGKGNDEVWIDDRGFSLANDPKWPQTANSEYKVVPEGFRGILRKISKEYGNPEVYVLENGYADRENLNDYERIQFYYSYLKEMLLAMKEGCNVKAYTLWSIIDNFEWTSGYSVRYGIVHIDFNDPERVRTYKLSAKWFKDVLRTRKLIPVKYYMPRGE